MLMTNPEFRKNFRLEVNSTRVISCFALLALVLFALYDGNGNRNSHGLHTYAEKFFVTFCGIGYFFTIIWGTYLCAGSIYEEVRQKTWDFVRMSSLSPAKILFGKLFGATSLIWIVTTTAIVPVLTVAAFAMIPESGSPRAELPTVLSLITGIVAWTILSHALGLIFALHGMSQQRGDKFNTGGVTILIAICGLFAGMSLINGFEQFHETYRMNRPTQALWYGTLYHSLDLALLALLYTALWAVMGAYRMLRQSLLFLDKPWAWIGFLLLTGVFLNGFATDPDFRNLLYWPLVLSMVTMAMMAVHEARDVVRYKTFAARINARRYADAFRYVPLWMISFITMVVFMIISLITINHQFMTVMAVLSLLTFACRDLLILHWISWKPSIKRPLLGFAFYGVIAYMLVPAVCGSIFSPTFAAYFFPLLPKLSRAAISLHEGQLFFYWAFQVGSLALAGWLFSGRWKAAFGGKTLAELTPPAPQVPPQTAG